MLRDGAVTEAAAEKSLESRSLYLNARGNSAIPPRQPLKRRSGGKNLFRSFFTILLFFRRADLDFAADQGNCCRNINAPFSQCAEAVPAASRNVAPARSAFAYNRRRLIALSFNPLTQTACLVRSRRRRQAPLLGNVAENPSTSHRALSIDFVDPYSPRGRSNEPILSRNFQVGSQVETCQAEIPLAGFGASADRNGVVGSERR